MIKNVQYISYTHSLFSAGREGWRARRRSVEEEEEDEEHDQDGILEELSCMSY